VQRIVRVPIYHEGTFRAIVSTALSSGSCVSYAGESWEPIEESGAFGVYRLAPAALPLMQERIENYEDFFYSRLLEGWCGTDGVMRPRTRLRRGPNRALRSGLSMSSAAGRGARP
jgi:hypothetical protein